MLIDNQNLKIKKVTITIYEENTKERRYDYEQPCTVTLGRDPQCDIQLDVRNLRISRNQSEFIISEQDVRVKDCDSKNGTYLNGLLIGKREQEELPELPFMESYYVADGDVLLLGDSSIQVFVEIERAQLDEGELSVELLDDKKEEDVEEKEVSEEVISEEEVPEKVDLQEEVHEEFHVVQMKEPKPEKGSRYRLGKRLGSGKFASVYKIKGDETKVMKVFSPYQDDVLKVRFEREAKVGCMLTHPNLIKAYQYGYRLNNRPYIVMEAASGMTLQEFREKMKSRLTSMVCVEIILIVLDVLHYLHTVEIHMKKENGTEEVIKGIIHRDMKPENILVNEDPKTGEFEIKVADLGLIKLLEDENDLEVTQDLTLGTFAYMAREQEWDSSHVSSRVDVWAAAAILFYLLTGQVPREKASNYKEVHEYDARKIREVNPNVPTALAEIVDRALLESDAPERITTAKQFIQLLEQWEEEQ